MRDQLKQITEKILGYLQVADYTIECRDTDLGQVCVAVTVPEGRLLVGRGGENLRSFNTLVKNMMDKKYSEKEKTTGAEGGNTEKLYFYIDINDYRTQQIQKIINLAKIHAARAVEFQKDIELDPMSSYDRMIVHNTLADSPHLSTESTGFGRNRHVVIKFVE